MVCLPVTFVMVKLPVLSVSRMKLPNGWPQLSGAFATRLPHAKFGAACARSPSQIVVLDPRFCRILYDIVLGLMSVASGKRYGMPPKTGSDAVRARVHRVAGDAPVRVAADDGAAFLVVSILAPAAFHEGRRVHRVVEDERPAVDAEVILRRVTEARECGPE